MEMTFDPAMINFRCLGNPANGFMPSIQGHLAPETNPRTLDEETDEFLEEQLRHLK